MHGKSRNTVNRCTVNRDFTVLSMTQIIHISSNKYIRTFGKSMFEAKFGIVFVYNYSKAVII